MKVFFYYIIKIVSLKKEKKYVNKKMLLKYFTPNELLISAPEIAEIMQQISEFQLK